MGQTMNDLARIRAPGAGDEVEPSIRVLLIEDDPTSAELTSLFLRSDTPSPAVTIAATHDSVVHGSRLAPTLQRIPQYVKR